MNEEEIKCECGVIFKKQDFKNHFRKCIDLISKFQAFDYKMIQLIKTYINSKESMIIIKFFLQRYIKILNFKLNKVFNISINRQEKNNNNIPQISFINNNNERGNKAGVFSPIYAENENQGIFHKTTEQFKPRNNNVNLFNNFNPIYTENDNNRGIFHKTMDEFKPRNNNGNIVNNFNPIYAENNNNNNNLKNSNNQIINNTEIVIKFKYIKTNLIYSEKGKMNEKLINVIQRFEKGSCPSWMKNFLSNPTYKGQKIDPQKTLYEIGIKDSEIIEFINTSNNKNNNNNIIINNKNIKNNNNNINNNLNNNINSNINNKNIQNQINIINKNLIQNKVIIGDLNSIIELHNYNTPNFKNQIQPGIFINNNLKQHKHNLTFCITIFPWMCIICQRNYYGDNPRYYCSLCDFNICTFCKEDDNYNHPPEFNRLKPPELNVKQKFIENNLHEHKLVYLSRRADNCSSWKCNICQEDYSYEIWSFYCTECDFDICANCIKKQ